MALIDCPACGARVSSVTRQCPECGFDLQHGMADEAAVQRLRQRRYRDRMYVLKMLSYVAMSIALVGVIPMLWAYIQSLENGGRAVSLAEHWGIYAVGMGFVFYVVVRVRMVYIKSEYRRGR